jgi:hypothetical protein
MLNSNKTIIFLLDRMVMPAVELRDKFNLNRNRPPDISG